MKVNEVMSQDLVCCTPDTPLQEAARLMAQSDCGALPVVESADNLRLKGIVTDRDIVVRCLASGKNPLEAKVSDCMTPRVFTAQESDELKAAERVMEEHQVRRVPVTDGSGACCGIVSQADIALKAPEHEVAEVVKEISQPVHRG